MMHPRDGRTAKQGEVNGDFSHDSPLGATRRARAGGRAIDRIAPGGGGKEGEGDRPRKWSAADRPRPRPSGAARSASQSGFLLFSGKVVLLSFSGVDDDVENKEEGASGAPISELPNRTGCTKTERPQQQSPL